MRVFSLLVALIVLLLLLRTPAEKYISSFFHFALQPVYVVQIAVGDKLESLAYLLNSKKSLRAENTRLKDTLDALVVESYAAKSLRADNQYLKSVLHRDTSRDFMLSRVLAYPGAIPYDTLLIDVGSESGAETGMRVFADGDFVIGEITRVFQKSALVTLYSTFGNEFSVTLGATATPATARGVGNGNFRLILPKGVPVEMGDIVEIPEIGPAYAGIVGAVEKSAERSLQEVYFRWPFGVSTLRYVYLEVESKNGQGMFNVNP